MRLQGFRRSSKGSGLRGTRRDSTDDLLSVKQREIDEQGSGEYKIARILNNLNKQVRVRFKRLPYEIYKCFDKPFDKDKTEFYDVEFLPYLEVLNLREQTILV